MAYAARSQLVASLVAVAVSLAAACGTKQQQIDGYKAGAVPGSTRHRAIAILGKPQEAGPFSLSGIQAEVLTYQFGQVLLQNGVVVAVSVNNDPQFRGPFGVTLGMSEDDLHAALALRHPPRAGHKESYDAIEKSNDTRTRDIYDETDHVMIELTAANANDPLAPFNVAQVTFANSAGMQLLEEFTKARVNGLYPDVHVDNFVSESWQSGR